MEQLVLHLHSPGKETFMTKTLASLILAAFGAVAFNAHAASHAGGAPMKADGAASAASGAHKMDKKAATPKKDEAKKDMKKEEMKKEEMKKEEMKK